MDKIHCYQTLAQDVTQGLIDKRVSAATRLLRLELFPACNYVRFVIMSGLLRGVGILTMVELPWRAFTPCYISVRWVGRAALHSLSELVVLPWLLAVDRALH